MSENAHKASEKGAQRPDGQQAALQVNDPRCGLCQHFCPKTSCVDPDTGVHYRQGTCELAEHHRKDFNLPPGLELRVAFFNQVNSISEPACRGSFLPRWHKLVSDVPA